MPDVFDQIAQPQQSTDIFDQVAQPKSSGDVFDQIDSSALPATPDNSDDIKRALAAVSKSQAMMSILAQPLNVGPRQPAQPPSPSFLPQSASQVDAQDAKTAIQTAGNEAGPILDKIGNIADYVAPGVLPQLQNSLAQFQVPKEAVRQFISDAGNQFGGAGLERMLPQKVQQASAGLTDSFAGQVSNLTSPDNIEILGSMALLPETGIAKIAQRAISLGFSAQAAYGAASAIKDASQTSDPQEFWKKVGDAVGGAAIAGLAGRHGLKGEATGPQSPVPEAPDQTSAASVPQSLETTIPVPEQAASTRQVNDLLRQQASDVPAATAPQTAAPELVVPTDQPVANPSGETTDAQPAVNNAIAGAATTEQSATENQVAPASGTPEAGNAEPTEPAQTQPQSPQRSAEAVPEPKPQDLGISEARSLQELGSGSVEPGAGAELGSGLAYGRDYINKGGDPRLPIRRATASGLVGRKEVGIVHAELERLRGIRDQAAKIVDQYPNDPLARNTFEAADKAQRDWRKELQPVLTKASDALREAYATSTVPDVGTYHGFMNAVDEHYKGKLDLSPKERTLLARVPKKIEEVRGETAKAIDRVIEKASRNRKIMTPDELRDDLASVLSEKFKDCFT